MPWDESKTANPGRIEQVWFAGVHSNVGDGYPRQGMSLVTLDWIMTKAEEPPHNLRFVLAERLMYRSHADVDDKMYDSRRGFGVFYLWKPRNIQRLCDMNGITPNVHRSVFERIARSTEGYAPGSIPADPVVVSISQTATVTDDIRSIVRKHHGGGGPLLEREAIAQGIGRWSYRLFVYSVVVTVLATLKEIVASQFAGDATLWEIVAGVVGTLASWKSVTFVFQTLCQYPWLIFWFLFALGSGLAVDQRLDRRYSHFWHADYIRLELRKRMGLG